MHTAQQQHTQTQFGHYTNGYTNHSPYTIINRDILYDNSHTDTHTHIDTHTHTYSPTLTYMYS